MGTVVLFDQDGTVAQVMRHTLERSGACKAVIASDKAEVLLALTCRSDVTAAVLDASFLSENEIDDLYLELHQAGRAEMKIVFIAAPGRRAHAIRPDVVRLSRPFDNQMLVAAVRRTG